MQIWLRQQMTGMFAGGWLLSPQLPTLGIKAYQGEVKGFFKPLAGVISVPWHSKGVVQAAGLPEPIGTQCRPSHPLQRHATVDSAR